MKAIALASLLVAADFAGATQPSPPKRCSASIAEGKYWHAESTAEARSPKGRRLAMRSRASDGPAIPKPMLSRTLEITVDDERWVQVDVREQRGSLSYRIGFGDHHVSIDYEKRWRGWADGKKLEFPKNDLSRARVAGGAQIPSLVADADLVAGLRLLAKAASLKEGECVDQHQRPMFVNLDPTSCAECSAAVAMQRGTEALMLRAVDAAEHGPLAFLGTLVSFTMERAICGYVCRPG